MSNDGRVIYGDSRAFHLFETQGGAVELRLKRTLVRRCDFDREDVFALKSEVDTLNKTYHESGVTQPVTPVDDKEVDA